MVNENGGIKMDNTISNVINQYKDQIKNSFDFYNKILEGSTMHEKLNELVYGDASRKRGVNFAFFAVRAY